MHLLQEPLKPHRASNSAEPEIPSILPGTSLRLFDVGQSEPHLARGYSVLICLRERQCARRATACFVEIASQWLGHGMAMMAKSPHDFDNVVNLRHRRQAMAISQPLDFFRKEHRRHRTLCRRLFAVVEALPELPNAVAMAEILVFLRDDLPMHFIDEEEHLFPLLRSKSLVGDPVDAWIRQLCCEHAADLALCSKIEGWLNDLCAAGQTSGSDEGLVPVPDMVTAAQRFAECQHRHALWEDIVILPHAEMRFSPSDWRQLGAELSARRVSASS